MSQLDENQLITLAGLQQPPENSQPGFGGEQDLEDIIVPNQEEEDLEPFSQQTELSFSSNPIFKIIFVFGGVTLCLFILWMLMNNFSNRNLATSVDTKQNDSEQETSTTTQPIDVDNADIKTELALAEQKRQLEMLSEKEKSTTIVEPPISEPVQTPPVVVTTPEPKPQQPEPEEKKIDPYQAQARALNLGSFGNISNPPPSAETILTTPREEPPISNQISEASYLPPPPQNLESQKTQVVSQQQLEAPLFRQKTPNFSETVIPAGTKARAYLLEDIFWEEENSLIGQQFRIALAEPIRNSQGEIVAPVSTLLLVSIVNYSSTGLVVLQPEAIIVNGVHLPLTKEVLSIESADDDYLLAERVHRGGKKADSGEIVLDLLGTAGDLELFDPSISRRIERTSRRFERNRPNRNLDKPLWVLPSNTQLELFFRRPFPIILNSSPPNPSQIQSEHKSFKPNRKIIGLRKSQGKINNNASENINVANSGIYLSKTPKLNQVDSERFFFPVALNATDLGKDPDSGETQKQNFCLNNRHLCHSLRI